MSEGLLVDEAMSLGLQAELLGMLDGSSQYFDARFFEDLDRHSRRLRSMALLHLQFAGTPGMSSYLLEKMLADYRSRSAPVADR